MQGAAGTQNKVVLRASALGLGESGPWSNLIGKSGDGNFLGASSQGQLFSTCQLPPFPVHCLHPGPAACLSLALLIQKQVNRILGVCFTLESHHHMRYQAQNEPGEPGGSEEQACSWSAEMGSQTESCPKSGGGQRRSQHL